jgi:hypothetical protein
MLPVARAGVTPFPVPAPHRGDALFHVGGAHGVLVLMSTTGTIIIS